MVVGRPSLAAISGEKSDPGKSHIKMAIFLV